MTSLRHRLLGMLRDCEAEGLKVIAIAAVREAIVQRPAKPPRRVRRPRGRCPDCGRDVAVLSDDRVSGYHRADALGRACAGAGKRAVMS